MSALTNNEAGDNERRRIRPVRVVQLLLATWAAVAFVLLVLGALAIRDARGHLGRAKEELALTNVKAGQAPNAREVADALGRAHTMFGSPIVAPIKWLPVFGRQLRAVDGIAHAGHVAAEIGIDALRRAQPWAASPPKNGPARLKALETIHEVAHDGFGRLHGLDFGPSTHLLSPIAKTRAQFVVELNRVGEVLQRADAGTAGLIKFFKGPSRYAVFAANNSEMRAGSGMVLSAGTLQVSNGELALGPMQNYRQLPPAPDNVALEYDFLRLWGPQAPGSDYRFVNMTPRFPTSGALLQRMWAAAGSPPVDGVLLLDPVAVADLVKAVGPVKANDVRITGKNARPLLLHDQYLQYDSAHDQKQERRDFLADVVQQLFAKLNGGSASPDAVVRALGRAGAGRHILAWTSDTVVQRGWSATQLDGVLPDQSVMFALQNRGGTKLDYFQKVDATVGAAVGQRGSVINMDFTLTNTVPANEPAYIAGGPKNDSFVKQYGVYAGIVAIDLPANATNVKLTGGDYDLVSGPDGNMQVVSQWVEISPGERLRLHLRFSLPPGYQSLSIEPSARVPEVAWKAGKRSWTDASARVITW